MRFSLSLRCAKANQRSRSKPGHRTRGSERRDDSLAASKLYFAILRNGFLSQIITFTDADLEKLYVFGRLLLRKLPIDREQLPVEIQQNIDMDSYRLQQTRTGGIALDRGQRELEPIKAEDVLGPGPEDIEPLSQIIRDLNVRFGTDFTEDDKVFIRAVEERLESDPSLDASMKVNTRENARLTFDHVANDKIQELVDTNFKFYKQINDDQQFGKFFLDWLFDRYSKREAV